METHNPSAVPHLSEYFGPWAIEETAGRALARLANKIKLQLHMETRGALAQEKAAAETRKPQVVEGETAFVFLSGPLTKQVGSLAEGTSTVLARQRIRAAAADPNVANILILIDSPGGTVSGTQELADDVAAAAKKKPVYAQIEDLGASAAYWIAAQADKVFANRTARVGSIGTLLIVEDLSKRADQKGVKVHVVRAGAFKGMGVPGTEITDEQLVEAQRIVDDLNEHFLDAVSKGRGLAADATRQLADGRVHLAAEAQKLGLIDGVQSLDETLAQLRQQGADGRPPKPKSGHAAGTMEGSKLMTEPNPVGATGQSGPAAYDEIVAACPNADAAFICEQLKAKATVDQARTAWMAALNQRLQASEAEKAKLAKEKAEAEAKPAKPGVAPLTTKTDGQPASEAGADCDDLRVAFNEKIESKMKLGMDRVRAVRAVARENSDLREAMVAAANAK